MKGRETPRVKRGERPDAVAPGNVGAPHPSADLPVAEHLRRARRLGHAPGAWLPSPIPAPTTAVQRDIYVAGKRVPPTGKAGKALLAKARLALLTAGLSPHGSGAFFKDLADEDHRYDFSSDEKFVETFVEVGKAEAIRVETDRKEEKRLAKQEGRDPETIRGWTRALKVNRPAWPEFYKKLVRKGEDIRHIVRNATLKSAIEAERSFQLEAGGEPQALRVMNGIAVTVGLPPQDHSFEAMMEIYKAAYLNVANLFPGPGAVNRVIGLTADRIASLGLELAASTEFATPEVVLEAFEKVQGWIRDTSEQTRRNSKAARFLDDFDDFTETIEAYLDARSLELAEVAGRADEDPEDLGVMAMEIVDVGVTEAEIGRELIDIGANFGFDLPDEPLDNQHMKALIDAEIYFAQYTGGNPDELAEMLKRFLGQKKILGA